MLKNNLLIVVVGPTAVGKTTFSIQLAKTYQCDVLSADSRQFYKEMTIGTAKPTPGEMSGVKHHFIDFLPVEGEMSAGNFEIVALRKLEELFSQSPKAILTGGSGLYVQAVCHGMSEMPSPPVEIRSLLMQELKTKGLEILLLELKEKDIEYYNKVDRSNHQRVVRALEMVRFTGKPFSALRSGPSADRNFNIVKIGLEMDRDLLYERIDRRVDEMIEGGLEEEVKKLYPKKHLNALQTVGYKEYFDFMDGKYSREEAIRLIKRNTRRYAKRQMTWFKKDDEIAWFTPDEVENAIDYIHRPSLK